MSKYLKAKNYKDFTKTYLNEFGDINVLSGKNNSGKTSNSANKGKAVDNVGVYLIKYMNKDLFDERLLGKKSFFTSKNLKRPEVIYENLEINACLKKYNLSINDLVYNNSFMSMENGRVTYLEFNKKRNI